MTPRAEVDHDVCAGFSECVRISPGRFRLNADNQSEPVVSEEGANVDELIAAAEQCPTQAISVYSDDDTAIYSPVA